MNICDRFSSFRHLIVFASYCLRFLVNVRKPTKYRNFDAINLQEAYEAELRLILYIQQSVFHVEIQSLRQKKPLPHQSKLKALNIFLDNDNMIRVGGRLQHAKLPYNQQHQIVLPKCHFSKLILEHLHKENKHCGPAALLSTSRQRFWILGARSTCKQVVHHCMPCFKHKPILLHQIMDNLPADRVNRNRAFAVTGVDFCGPFYIRPQPRAKSLVKSYVAVFTCFVTRSTHLEVVMDLSTKKFLNAFRRFVSRRGIPSRMYSDNATNFAGSKNQLADLKKFFVNEATQRTLQHWSVENHIDWKTIPARSPHFGGIWESVVKQFKFHLKRSTSSMVFTPDDFVTLIDQIECVLNSRPLTAVSDSVQDFKCLTSGHFLIGQPLNLLLEPSWIAFKFGRLEAWQQNQFLLNQIWERFKSDYISALQRRSKWRTETKDIKVGIIVLLKSDAPPTQWPLGQLCEIFPGKDDHIRVVSVRTATGIFMRAVKRAVTELAPLPNQDETDI